MPFDGRTYSPAEPKVGEPEWVVEQLDALREMFGPNGEHWCRGVYARVDRTHGMQYCMAGAIKKLTTTEEARHALVIALAGRSPFAADNIVTRNDNTPWFIAIQQWLAEARAQQLLRRWP